MTPLMVIATWFALVSLIGGSLFALDKRLARANRRRVPERTLLLLALLGAAPITLFLARRIRHKTHKEPFRTYLRGALIINALAAIGLCLWAVGLL